MGRLESRAEFSVTSAETEVGQGLRCREVRPWPGWAGGQKTFWMGWSLDYRVWGERREYGVMDQGVPLLLPLCLQPLFAGMSKIISVVI